MRPYLREIGLTEARRCLSSIVREIEAEPKVCYQVKVRDKVVAELRSPASRRSQTSSGETLLRFAREMEALYPRKPGERLRNISGHFKDYLYGKRSPLLHRKRS
jgi:hypothetical protein